MCKVCEVKENAIYKRKSGDSYTCFAIVLEYIEGGEMIDYIMVTGRFDQSLARTYFIILLETLEHIHN